MNNRPFSSQLKIIKLDAESGKKVTLMVHHLKLKIQKETMLYKKLAVKNMTHLQPILKMLLQ